MKVEKSSKKLDPNDPYYRVCPYDGVEFMATHMLQKYFEKSINEDGTIKCCKDDHNSLKKPKYMRQKYYFKAIYPKTNPGIFI